MKKLGDDRVSTEYVHLLNRSLRLRPFEKINGIREKKFFENSCLENGNKISKEYRSCASPEDGQPSITSSTQEPSASQMEMTATDDSTFPYVAGESSFSVGLDSLRPMVPTLKGLNDAAETQRKDIFQQSDKENYPSSARGGISLKRRDPITGGAVAGYILPNPPPVPQVERLSVMKEPLSDAMWEIKKQKFISPNRLVLGSRINRGFFASIFEGRLDGNIVAVKIQEPCESEDPSMRTHRALQEWRILEKIAHPNLLKFHGGVLRGNEILLVLEYVHGGDLWTILNCKSPAYLRPPKRLDMIQQLAEVLEYLHLNNVAHKDVKSLNVLVTSDLNVRLCDLGDAEELVGENLGWCTAATWAYAPPEMITCKNPFCPEKATKNVDVWAFGCVVLELCGLPLPYERCLRNAEDSVQRSILQDLFLSGSITESNLVPSGLPHHLDGLLRMCFKFDTGMRASTRKVVRYIKNNREFLLHDLISLQARREGLLSPPRICFHHFLRPTFLPYLPPNQNFWHHNYLPFPYGAHPDPWSICRKPEKFVARRIWNL